MSRLIFEDQRPVLQVDTGRTDVACFVGLVRCAWPPIPDDVRDWLRTQATDLLSFPFTLNASQSPPVPPANVLTWFTAQGWTSSNAFSQLTSRLASNIPPAVQTWLQSAGWLQGPYAREMDQLADIPIPVESYAGFTAMFDTGTSGATNGTDYLAAAVRSFFAQGGRRCYIIRVDDPVTPSDQVSGKATKLQEILLNDAHNASDPRTWHGVGHLAGLTDVSLLAIPDLPVLLASDPILAAGVPPSVSSTPEQFVECSQADITPPPFHVNQSPAPRLSPSAYGTWAQTVATILQYLASNGNNGEIHLREIQFVAALPLPQDLDVAAAAENPASESLAQDVHNVIASYMPEQVESDSVMGISGMNISTAFLQLAYPWLKTSGSQYLLEALESPDGALVGLISRNALKRGTFTSATKIKPAEIVDVYPPLPAKETRSSALPLIWGNNSWKPLIERISLFGFTPGGLELLSDVTAYPGEAYRSGRVNRMVSVIHQAARHMGEHAIFEQNGPILWGRMQRSLQQLLTRLWTLQALDGATVQDAFSVRCDPSTMTQNDHDNGRMVAIVTFTPSATVEVIRITMALQTGGASINEIAAAMAGVA
jgi:hypothetical protein